MIRSSRQDLHVEADYKELFMGGEGSEVINVDIHVEKI